MIAAQFNQNLYTVSVHGNLYTFNPTSGQFTYGNGSTITDTTVLNKCWVKFCVNLGILVKVAHLGCKYAVLPSDRIISLNKTSMGKEVYRSQYNGDRKKIMKLAEVEYEVLQGKLLESYCLFDTDGMSAEEVYDRQLAHAAEQSFLIEQARLVR